MRIRLVSSTLFAMLLAMFCLSAHAAPNTTVSGAVSYEVGQGWVSHYISELTPNRWFKFTSTGGRSYCLEAAQGSDSPVAFNPNITLYADVNGTAALGSNDNGTGEPAMTLGSRYCFADTAVLDTRTVRSVRLNVPVAAGSGDDGYMRLRIVDTTLVAGNDWNLAQNGLLAGDYSANFVLHNLTGSAITVTYQSSGGCAAVPNACPAPPSGSIVVAARSAGTIDVGSTGTQGWRFYSLGVLAPLGAIRLYRTKTDTVTGATLIQELLN